MQSARLGLSQVEKTHRCGAEGARGKLNIVDIDIVLTRGLFGVTGKTSFMVSLFLVVLKDLR
jgi:hypothetical protein